MNATHAPGTMWAVGLMCGTSLDGVDAAAIRFDEARWPHSIEVVDHLTAELAGVDVRRLRAIAGGAAVTAEELSALRFEFAGAEEAAVRRLCERIGVAPELLAYVASHGVTLCHRPESPAPHGWQLSSGAVLAARLGCPVVDDFRAGDLALHGQGAPLAPLADFALRASGREHRAILNLGGIANITVLPRGVALLCDVICGDVGPANLPLDEIARRELGRPFDEDGRVASEGAVDETVLAELLDPSWVRQPLPRSFGREQFGPAWVDAVESRMAGATTADRLATVVALEVAALKIFVEEYVGSLDDRLHLYVTGGGRRHRGWWDRANTELRDVELHGIEELGVPADAKEAVDFAYLGGQTVQGRSAEQSALTGARQDIVLGSLHRPIGDAAARDGSHHRRSIHDARPA